jgi:hypothetical protein
MAMVNMMQSAEEAKEDSAPSADDAPKYPYGLCISLDEEVLAKLGMTQPPAVGTKFTLTANATVTSASSYQTEGSENESSSSWQITDMEVASPTRPTSSADAASMLYGD